MAGEAEEARPSSCTDRSNICEEAGDGIPGEDELRLRDGDAGATYGCEIVCVIGAPTPGTGDIERMVFVGAAVAVAAVVEGVNVEAVSLVFLVLSSNPSFFLPKPQNLRFPVFPSSSGAAPASGALFKPSPKSGTDDVRDPVSSPASLLRLIRLSAIVPNGREGLLRLHGWARSDFWRKYLVKYSVFSDCECPGKGLNACVMQRESAGRWQWQWHTFQLCSLLCGLL